MIHAMNRESSQSQGEAPIIDNQLSLPALTNNNEGDEPALFYPPSPMAVSELKDLNNLNLERCTSNPLVRGYSNISVTSDEGAHFIPFGRNQADLLFPSPVPSPLTMGQFRFDAQAINRNPISHGQDNALLPITPRPMENIYVPSKVALDPITDVSECDTTERTYVSSAMTGTCSNGTSVLHREDDEMEPDRTDCTDHTVEGIAQITQNIADVQLNAEVPAFMPINNNNNNGPMTPNQHLSNPGFVASSYIPFGLSGLPHPSQFSTLPQMQPRPMHTPPTMIMNAPNTATTAVQGSNYYMDTTQAQTRTQRGSPNFAPRQQNNATYSNQQQQQQQHQQQQYVTAPRRTSPPRNNTAQQTDLRSMSKCEDMIRVLEGIHPSRDINSSAGSSPTALPRLLEQNQIMRFMTDQTGSRYLQEKLASAPKKLVGSILEHILGAVLSLSEEKYANYVVQVFFEVGTPDHLALLMQHLLRGNVYRLSRHFYACRVIQKALDSVCREDCIALIAELEMAGRRSPSLIHECILCDNGNHVIQKMLTLKLDRSHIEFIIAVVEADLLFYSSQNYGCRIVQNVIEFYGAHNDKRLLREMVARENLLQMCQSQYGNYVIQRILKLCFGPDEFLSLKRDVMHNVFASVEQLSMNKFGSNVVESCLEKASERQRALLFDVILEGKDGGLLSKMVHHKFANYVIQKMLRFGSAKQVKRLVAQLELRIPPNQRNGPCVKHIFNKIHAQGRGGGGGGRGGKGARGGWAQNRGQNGQGGQKRGGRGGRW